MQISVGQALLILLEKYRDDPAKYSELRHLYLSGAKSQHSKEAIESYLTSPFLTMYSISKAPEIINQDSSRRYFETCLAFETLKHQLNNFSQSELDQHLEAVKKTAPAKWGELYNDILAGYVTKSEDNTRLEYADYLLKLKKGEIFSEFSEVQRIQIATLVSAAFVGMIIASQGSHLLPLDIYGSGIFTQRGKEEKIDPPLNSSALGILQNTDPVPLNDPARMLKTQQFLKPSDQSVYDLDALWVKDNFARLVHPFSNSISGTMLCQLRVLAKIRKESIIDDAIFSTKEKLASFFSLYISSLLFNAGGHTLHEFTAPISLEAVQTSFNDIPGFNSLDLDELFLNNNNGVAFDSALDKAIRYNNHIIQKSALKQEIRLLKTEFDQQELPKLIEQSNLSKKIKYHFNLLAKKEDGDLCRACLQSAQKLQLIILQNEVLLSTDLFSCFRQNTVRHLLLEKNLDTAITALCNGKPTEAKKIVLDTIEAISKYSASNKPELIALKSFYETINAHIDKEIQMPRS